MFYVVNFLAKIIKLFAKPCRYLDMENNSQSETRQLDSLEQLIAEIVADPQVRDEMLKIQPIDVQNN